MGWNAGLVGLLGLSGLVVVGAGQTALGQTGATATGDTRTVNEPVIPASCTVLQGAAFYDRHGALE